MKNRGLLAVATAMTMVGMPAQAVAQTCITRTEIAGMMGYAMPSVIEGVRNTCAAHLPADAFLATGVEAMIESYRAVQADNWPTARAAFMKFGADEGETDPSVMEQMPDELLQPLVEAMIPTMIEGEIKPGSCRDVDTLVASLAAMSPKQAGDFMAAILALTGDDKPGEKQRSPNVCAE
ncbi:hypothetical protein ATE62_11750 [Sphingopyxis sp. HIX]|uniref:hypothetical protein n=2 Tax=unclassified Sphingopyxis TaxID=2614943 RepID=UPI00073615CE|nr:hypothetical protein [Sphingopyxis sp. HIX]KTE38248.1 hypothetical protein ATE62_11750 [Sphingopyxis sp. HIX]